MQREERAVDVDVSSPPGQETVDESDEGDDTEQRADDTAGDLDTEHGTDGEGVQRVLQLFILVLRDDDVSSGERLLGLGVTELGDGQRRGDGHDARRDQHLGVQTETDVSDKDRSGDRGETASHDLVDLRLGHERDEWSDQHGGFSLTDKRRGGGDDSLGTGDTESPEDESRKLLDEPLDEADVVENLDEGDEEDDGGDDSEEEHSEVGRGLAGDERDTIPGVAEQVTGSVGDPLENVVSNTSSEDEQADDVLGEHSSDDGTEVDVGTVTTGGPESEQDDEEAEQTDGSVGARVVRGFLRDERADEKRADGYGSSGGDSKTFRDTVVDGDGGLLPGPLDGAGDIVGRDVECDETDGDRQPEEERHDPVLVLAVEDDGCDPPAGEKESDNEVNDRTTMSHEGSHATTESTAMGRRGRGLPSQGGTSTDVQVARFAVLLPLVV